MSTSVSRDADLEVAKRASVGQLLMKCGRLLDERGVEQFGEEMGVDTLRPAPRTSSRTSILAAPD